MTPPPGDAGGLLNAIVGSVVMTSSRIVVGTPIGMLAGTYMAEYGRFSRLTTVVRFINDILLSAPVDHHRPVRLRAHGRGRWGISRRSPAPWRWRILVIPVVVRTTEDMLQPGARTRCAKPAPRSARRAGS